MAFDEVIFKSILIGVVWYIYSESSSMGTKDVT